MKINNLRKLDKNALFELMQSEEYQVKLKQPFLSKPIIFWERNGDKYMVKPIGKQIQLTLVAPPWVRILGLVISVGFFSILGSVLLGQPVIAGFGGLALIAAIFGSEAIYRNTKQKDIQETGALLTELLNKETEVSAQEEF